MVNSNINYYIILLTNEQANIFKKRYNCQSDAELRDWLQLMTLADLIVERECLEEANEEGY